MPKRKARTSTLAPTLPKSPTGLTGLDEITALLADERHDDT